MRKLLVTSSLATAVMAAGLAASWHPLAQAAEFSLTGKAAQLTQQATFEKATYLVEFMEEGLLEHHRNLPETQSNAGKRKFDPSSLESRAYLGELQSVQASHVAAIQSKLGRGNEVRVTHYYLATHSGIAVEVNSQEQLDALKSLPFVRSVVREEVYQLDTHRSAAFVGADKIWDGSAIGNGTGTGVNGKGMVVAILDTGINAEHPSFANQAACEHDSSHPKLLSNRDCSTTDTNGVCNGTNLADTEGHGTHTASTTAGNVVTTADDPRLQPEQGTQISGIAPCASIRAYKVCATDTCANTLTMAGMNNAILDGDVAVSNFSIGGGTSPWAASDSDRKKLDMIEAGILTVASAGNTRTETPNPVGQVSHRGPWVTTVASSTHDQQRNSGKISAEGSADPLLTDIALLRGGASPNYTGASPLEIAHAPNDVATSKPEGCEAFPANHFQDKAALISRGSCSFVIKIQNAYNAGAKLVLIYNNAAGTISMGTDGQPNVPAFSMEQAAGNALVSFIANNPSAQISFAQTSPVAGDILSNFSFRGPTPGNLLHLTKPDITAPGDSVYAALPDAQGGYGWMGGTSMSGPQIAGGAVLVRQVHPDWSPIEVRSALMMTAKTTGTKDGVNGTPNTGPWDADDVGSGRLDLTKAARAGLVMDETVANFLASNPAQGGDVRTLNIPSVRNMTCTPKCTWTRTVRNTLGEATSWNASASGTGMSITVSPSSFQFTGNTTETQVLTITATPVGNQTSAVAFGQIDLVEAGGKSPDLHLTAAIKGTDEPIIAVNPAGINAVANPGATAPILAALQVKNIGGSPLNWSENATGTVNINGVLVDHPSSGTNGIVSHVSTATGALNNQGATTAARFSLALDTTVTNIEAYGFDSQSRMRTAGTSFTWAIYSDDAGKPSSNFEATPDAAIWKLNRAYNGTGVTVTGTNGATVALNLTTASQNVVLPAGDYWLTVYARNATSFSGTGAAGSRWNWLQSDPQGQGSMLTGSLFGATSWTATGTGGLGTAIEDVAYKLSGTQGVSCGASWVDLAPDSGTVAAGDTQNVVAWIDPTGLSAAVHKAYLCLDSDASNGRVIVPVTLDLSGAAAAATDLSLNATSMPDAVSKGQNVSFLINPVNFGPAAATGVKVALTFPSQISYVTSSTVVTEKADGEVPQAPSANNWSCTSVAPIVCSYTGSMSGAGQPLQVIAKVDPGAAIEGNVVTTVTISGNQEDPNPSNNTVQVLTKIVGEPLFSDGFEENNDIIDSGAVNLAMPAGSDVQLNLVTGQFGNYGAFTGADINWYDTGSITTYLFGDAPATASGALTNVVGGNQVAPVAVGERVGPASAYTSSGQSNMNLWLGGTTAYIGLRFWNEGTGAFNYGYIELQTTPGTGFPATIVRYVYDKSGKAVTIK